MAFGDVVQSNSGTSSTATTTPTLGSATTAGNLLVLTFAADDYNGTPNTGWTQSSEMEQQTFHGGYLWWLTATASMTIPSYTIGSAVRSAWTLVEYAGPFDASPYDTSQGVFEQSTTSATTVTTDNMMPTSGSRLLVAGLQAQHATSDFGSVLTSFTNSFTSSATSRYNGGSPRLNIAQTRRVVTADGSTNYSTSGADATSPSQSRSALIIAFKAGAGGGGTTYNDTTAETGSAADTPAGLLTTTKAIAETAAAAETTTGRIVTTKAVAETAAAADTVAGLAVSAGAIAETASAAETTTAAVVAAGVSAVAETASAVDALSGRLVISAAVAESASVVDTVVGTGPVAVYDVSVLEIAVAADTLTAAVIGPAPVPLPPPVTTLDATFAAFFPGAVVQQNLTDAVAYWIVTYGAVTADDVPAILALANAILAGQVVPPYLPAVQDDYSSPVPYPSGLPRFPDANPTPAGWSIVTDERVVRGVVT